MQHELATAIKALEKRKGTPVETWISIGLAFILTVVGGAIFWRTQVVVKGAAEELGETAAARLHALVSGSLLPFLALSAGCFLILVVTVLAMRWTRLHLERERRQTQLSDLVLRLLGQYQDENLGRISSWLHDGLGHGLVMQKLDIEYLLQKRLMGEDDGRRLIGHIKEMLDEARNMASMIYPHTLFQLGLQAALEGLIDNFCRVSHVEVEREIQGGDDCCSDEVALLAFRIVQEGLTNVAKHANASKVRVEAVCDGANICGRVCNNGPITPTDGKPGIGLMVMTERAKRLGGSVSVKSDGLWPYQLVFGFPSQRNGRAGCLG